MTYHAFESDKSNDPEDQLVAPKSFISLLSSSRSGPYDQHLQHGSQSLKKGGST